MSSRLGDMYTQQIECEMRSSRGPINHLESSLRSWGRGDREKLRWKGKTDNQGGKKSKPKTKGEVKE